MIIEKMFDIPIRIKTNMSNPLLIKLENIKKTTAFTEAIPRNMYLIHYLWKCKPTETS